MNIGEIKKAPIDGVLVKANKVIRDDRGFLAELMPGGLDNELSMGAFGNLYLSNSESKFGVRGGHYHKLEHSYESFYCIGGSVVWILCDYREDSPTHGVLYDIIVGEYPPTSVPDSTDVITIDQGAMAHVLVPPGVFHSFVQLSDEPAKIIGYHTEPYQEADYERIDLADVPGIDVIIQKYGFTL